MIKKTIKNIASKLGIVVVSKYDQEREDQYIEILEKFSQNKNESKRDGTSIIVFSKDRAMQLDTLLRSYFHFVANTVTVQVLYHASSPDFKKGYDGVKQIYGNKNVRFTEESKFKTDLVSIMDKIETVNVLFLVDDIMFKEPLNMDVFSSINARMAVASLRMGRHLNFSYTLQKTQKLPDFSKKINYPGMLNWSFRQGELDWAYPLSVDGHLFNTLEFCVLVKTLNYKAPNSFEEALQLMVPLYSKRLGLCFENSIIVNNPCNKVQNENDNVFGTISIDELNTKWLDGYRINFEEYEGIKNVSAHQELALNFVKR